MATPAAPILASSIWLAQQHISQNEAAEEPPSKRRKLATGVKAINDALEGGFDFGLVHCITFEASHGPKDIVQELLISHLTGETNATATVIDSTLSFDVRSLFQALESQLKDKQTALKLLDRLKISKVFDFVGLTEAIDEVRDMLQAEPSSLEDKPPPPKATIADSEDEEEEMLDGPDLGDEAPNPEARPNELRPPARLLVIDNISHVTSPLIKNNYPQGQALLTAMMRSLGHLTRTHDLCTVVFGTAMVKSSADDETLSLFKSCTIRPVLGDGLGHLLDVHMYLHQQPSRTTIAATDDAQEPQRAAGMVSVLEVVQDRNAGRFGRWGAFAKGNCGRLVDVE